MTVLAWVAVAVASAFLAWVTPRAATWVTDAIADKTAESLGDRIQPQWLADLDDTIEPVRVEMVQIRHELTANGGKTVKDLVIRHGQQLDDLQAQIEEVLTRGERGWPDPTGTPI